MSIRDDFFAAQAKASLWDVAVSIKRGNPLPLDANAVYKTLGTATVNGETTTYTEDSLLEYAKTNPVAYPGQVCAVVEADSTTIYYLDQNLDVKPVGVIPTGDNKTIEVTADGQISLFGADEATAGQQPRIVNKGTAEAPRLELEWYTPDNSTVAGLQDTVGALKESVDGIVEEDGTVTKEGLTHKVAALEEEKLDANGWVSNDFAKGWEYHQIGRNEEMYGSYNEAALYKSGIHFGHESSLDTGSTTDLNANGLRIYEYSSSGDNTELEITVDKITSKTHSSEFGIDDTSYEYNYPTQSGTLIVDKDLAPYAKTEDVNTALGNKADADDLTALEEKVDAFLTGDGTEAALDSLKELIKYIEEHDDVELADIIADVEALQTKVTLGTDAEGKEYTTVKAYVEAAIAALKIGDYAKAADLTTLAGRVSTLEAKPFDTYATKDEVNAKADASALDSYYTKTEVDETLQNYVTTGNFNDSIDQLNESISTITITYATKKELSDHADAAALAYATKEELKATDDIAKDSQNRVGIVEGKIDEITSVGGEPNVIEKIKVNGVTLEVEKDSEGKSTKTVSISVPTSIVDMDGYSALAGRVTANENAISALDGRVTTNATAIAALDSQLGTTNINVSSNTTEIGKINTEITTGLKPRLEALEGADEVIEATIAEHTAAIKTLNETTIPTLQGVVNTKAAQTDVDAINNKIGTVDEGKTVVEMIKAVDGKIDYSPYATKKEVSENYATIAALEAIYKVTGEGESAVATGALATEIARATAAEKSLDDAIKLLTNGAGTSEIDSVVELIDYVNNHGATVDGINDRLDGIDDRLDGHNTLLAGIGGTDQPATVIAAIEAAKNEAIAAIPALAIANANTLGGVKSAADIVSGEVTSVATNKVYVDATSAVGEVKAISTDILVNGSEELILFGGNAGVNS